MKLALLTLGCRTNQAESLEIERHLQRAGHDVVSLSQKPDVCILNTCSVTAKADYQSRQLIQRALKSGSRVIVTGCYAELNGEMLSRRNIPLEIVRNDAKHTLFSLFPPPSSGNTKGLPHQSRIRPIIKVQDGCDHSCTYCIIPTARGRPRSVDTDEALSQISQYEQIGCHEIVLSGIHLGAYGLDLTPKRSLTDLLKHILANTGIPRIRLSSLEPKEIDDALLEVIAHDRLCSHLHVPLQSGHDEILRLMNRAYTVADYCATIERILKTVPDIALGTDVIVGFPGEGERHFISTREIIESLPFAYVHVFPYSPRPGTRAFDFPNKVSDTDKAARACLLREVASKKKSTHVRANLGRTLDIVVEREGPDGFSGTTRNYIKVLLPGHTGLSAGMLVNAYLHDYEKGFALGVAVNSRQAVNK